MEYPNKTYVAEYLREVGFKTKQTFKRTIIIAASDEDAAKAHLKVIVGSEPDDLTWLMDTNHINFYNHSGSKPLELQAKILYSTHCVLG
jgi:hypothetical protein